MKTILSIGHNHYLLPASVNVNTLLKTLSGARSLERDWNPVQRDTYKIENEIEIEIKIVKDEQVKPPKKAKQIPEKSGPEASGDMGV